MRTGLTALTGKDGPAAIRVGHKTNYSLPWTCTFAAGRNFRAPKTATSKN
jgi:hypothetical protein